MFVQATISCECGCIFDTEFQKSSVENPPVCPQCKKKMDKQSWESLRDIMSRTCSLGERQSVQSLLSMTVYLPAYCITRLEGGQGCTMKGGEEMDAEKHIIKWNLERGEPRMLVPAITARTL